MIREKRRGAGSLLDELIAANAIDRADLVGFTSMFSQNVACFAMARRLRGHDREPVILMGGANCEWPMGQEIVKQIPQIDFVFSGCSLKSFPEFVQCLLEGRMNDCHRLNGVFSRSNRVASQPLVADSFVVLDSNMSVRPTGDELDINVNLTPDYEPYLTLLEKNFPAGMVKSALPFETSRGCWWGERAHCTFCGLNGSTMAYRAMQPEKAIRLFETLFGYADRCSHFECVDNIMPKSYIKEVFAFLNPPRHTTIFYEVKADLMESDIEVLARARVVHLQPGIESLATSTLKLMKKGTTSFQNITLLKNCIAHGVSPHWNLLVGFPGEGEDVYQKYVRDLPLLMHLYPPNGVFPVRFDRYSPYFVRAHDYQLDLHPCDYYNFVYPLDAGALANLAYYFANHDFGAEYVTALAQGIGPVTRRIEAWQQRWSAEIPRSYPKLFFTDGDSGLIRDSRSQVLKEQDVGKLGRMVLESLAQPKGLRELASALSDVAELNPESELARLCDLGLVFGEQGRDLSLVFPREPPPVAYFTASLVEKEWKNVDSSEPAMMSIARARHRVKKSSLDQRAGVLLRDNEGSREP